MPRKWISTRGPKRPNDAHNKENTDFNFVFRPVEVPKDGPSLGSDSPSLAHRVSMARPQSSGGISEQGTQHRRVSDPTIDRPRTSEAMSPPAFCHSTSKSPSPDAYDMIGMAYGSPTHPPTDFYQALDQAALDSIPPAEFDALAFEKCWPLDDRLHSSKNRWRKFGGLFKSKPLVQQKQTTSEPFYKAQAEHDRQIDLSIVKEVLEADMLSESPITLHNFPAPPNASRKTALEIDQDPRAPNAALLAALPKLQVDIPSPKLDRYTLMFGDVQASKTSSNLLARRSRVLDQLRANAGYPPRKTSREPFPTEDPTLLVTPRTLARRQTSPTFPTDAPYSPASPVASGNSINLTASANTSILDRPRGKAKKTPLLRSMTSPARISPMRETFDVPKPQPLRVRKNSDKWVTSPEQSTASTENTAMWSADTFLSPASAMTPLDDEILFDVKSLRDSGGLEGQTFEMTRPDSTAVALYRTMSQKYVKPQRPRFEDRMEVSTPDTELDIDDSKTIDETIAAVEKLATPVSSRNASPAVKTHIGLLVDSSPKAEGRVVKQVRVVSPTPTPTGLQIADFQKRNDTPEVVSPAAPPPPVPAKDSKFIPVSKYASRPARPNRSRTESSAVLPVAQSKYSTTNRPVRAVTESDMRHKYIESAKHPASRSDDSLASLAGPPRKPTRAAHLKPLLVAGITSNPTKATAQVPEVSTRPTVTVPVIVQPAAEVSIARTVSLARKESRRVLVTPGLTAKRREAREAEHKQKRQKEKAEDEWDEEKRKTTMELKNLAQKVSPVVVQVQQGHRVGKSVGGVIECV